MLEELLEQIFRNLASWLFFMPSKKLLICTPIAAGEETSTVVASEESLSAPRVCKRFGAKARQTTGALSINAKAERRIFLSSVRLSPGAGPKIGTIKKGFTGRLILLARQSSRRRRKMDD